MDITIPLNEPYAFDINSWLYNVKSYLNNMFTSLRINTPQSNILSFDRTVLSLLQSLCKLIRIMGQDAQKCCALLFHSGC